jgi:hypothetical protein
MMSEQQRGIRFPTDGSRHPADDVEGHMPLRYGAHAEPDDETDDSEGHAYKIKVQDEPQDDVEGHGARFNGVADEPAQVDVEGHGYKIRSQDDQQDDVEGHGFRGNVEDEPASGDDDVEGHSARLKV